MAQRIVPFAIDEWYHCYSRGVEKRKIFFNNGDYNRFLHALYLGNSDVSIHRSDLRGLPTANIFSIQRGAPLVAIGAYCLMPNHFHLLLKEIVEGGISAFMQKIGTAYSMYFNIKYEHHGGLFSKPFRSKHVEDDRYLRRVAQYIHLNPAELFDPNWKKGSATNLNTIESRIISYRYCSLADYCGNNRPEKSILDNNAMELLGGELSPFGEILAEMQEYYQELVW